MKSKNIFFCLFLYLSLNISVNCSGLLSRLLFGQIIQPSNSNDEFPDYSDLVFEEINIEMDEIGLDLDAYREKIDNCIKICIEKNPNEKFKSNCVQKTCEIY
jgi:hypothetical protein